MAHGERTTDLMPGAVDLRQVVDTTALNRSPVANP